MASNIRNCPIIPPILSEEFVLLQIEDLRLEISRREQEILQMSTKMKTLEEQHQDYQKHIAVLKESLCAKEEHYTMLQTDVSSVHSQANRKVHFSLLIIIMIAQCVTMIHLTRDNLILTQPGNSATTPLF